MKEFENWFDRIYPDRIPMDRAEGAWRAALEWQLKLIKQYQDGKLYVADIRHIIEEELNGPEKERNLE